MRCGYAAVVKYTERGYMVTIFVIRSTAYVEFMDRIA